MPQIAAVVGAGGTAYVVAVTNIDPEVNAGDGTLWVISPNSTQPFEVAIGPVGEPVSLAVGGDSAFLTTSRDDPSDPNTQIYEVTPVTIPSQAV